MACGAEMLSLLAMQQPQFIHLRVHSAYSLSEGAVQVKQMGVLAAKNGMPAVAITDTGNLFGALEFSDAMMEKGIQPIVGTALKVDLSLPDATPQKQHIVGTRRTPRAMVAV
jgi:DNA polymerase III subunit alpha